ncbi:MAG: hypothetical protein U5O16_19850 [Rhodococcus sp. (in: high G+C Gram-positive bacteria)]|nr:hypothetical protein [Rhodococcus sp. (in: high G+C Gram-positive bacteria)]
MRSTSPSCRDGLLRLVLATITLAFAILHLHLHHPHTALHSVVLVAQGGAQVYGASAPRVQWTSIIGLAAAVLSWAIAAAKERRPRPRASTRTSVITRTPYRGDDGSYLS